MAMLAKIARFFRLIPEKAFPVGAVRTVTAHARHGPSRPPGIVHLVNRVRLSLPLYAKIGRGGRIGMAAAEDACVTFFADFISFKLRQVFKGGRMVPMTIEALAVSHRFMHVFAGKPFRVMTGITKIGR